MPEQPSAQPAEQPSDQRVDLQPDSQPDSQSRSEAPRRFLFLDASARVDGNSARLARLAAESSLPVGAEQRWLRLSEHPLPPFQDLRHTGDGRYPEPVGHERTLLDATLAATDLVFVAPLYWYSLPTTAKLYLDYWSAWFRVPGVDFRAGMRGGTIWGVTALAGGGEKADPLIGTLRLTAEYMDMRWGGALLGNGTRPGDVLRDERALVAAKSFFAG
ncbi:multimeric flavodoxin WrbA [Streptomyces sp. 1114.5]|uniref:flavodoxin family protein n=1 Tax=Streptomyces sp. 1114.5 TaxID=1938830 RepID=UPI000EB2CA6E|nr:NAD(P)H-dependent oxidoreductase [Streptomyces sp. 1114.5]RKT16866.1 multimeric flavodoxin WrbA [Streptomyces sp. 1114.5]